MSLNIVSLEPCPYHEDSHNSQTECDCTVGMQTSLDHHIDFAGSYKRAFYGLVVPQIDANQVHQKMERIQNQDGIYTLIMNCNNEFLLCAGDALFFSVRSFSHFLFLRHRIMCWPGPLPKRVV